MKARKTSNTPKRGYHSQVIQSKASKFADTVYVRNGYQLIPCDGEAHTNAHIDNCMSCLSGEWGWKLTKKK